MLETLKALADLCRLRLLAVLLRGEFTVQELTNIFGMGQSRISRHLKILTEAGILKVKRQGTWSYYWAGGDDPFFCDIRLVLEKALKSIPEHDKDMAAVASILEERRRRSQEFFDRHARQWDDLARTLLPVPEYRELLLELIPSGGCIVEIGVGTGGLLPALAAKTDNLIGVDRSPAMLDEARRRLALAGIAGLDLRLGEMEHLPLPDQSASCAVLNMVLHHAAEPQFVLAEIQRVLTDGGTVIIADLARHERELAREQLADQWLGFDAEELTGWLKGAGFHKIDFTQIPPQPGQEAVLILQAHKSKKEK